MKLLMKVLVLLIFFTHSALFASAGKVSLLNGEAYAQRDSQKIALQNGSILEEKDVIITAKGAQVQLIFEDKTVITLGSESELKIEEYLNDATKPKAKFKFGEGSFKSITGQIGKTAPENFTLETKTATIGIRGTTIRGYVRRGGDTIACLSGTITVGAIGSPNIVVVPAGKSTFVAPGTPPTPPQTIKPQSGGTSPAEGSGTPPTEDNPPPPPAGDNPPPPPPPPSDFSAITNQANQDDLNKQVQQQIVNTSPIYNGFITSYIYESESDTQHSFIAQKVSYDKGSDIGQFTFSAPAYELSPLTGILTPTNTPFSGYVFTDTGHYGSVDGEPIIKAIPIANTHFSYFDNYYANQASISAYSYFPSERIWFDKQGEIAIYASFDDVSSTLLFLGPQSKTLPEQGLLYFLDSVEFMMYQNMDFFYTSLINPYTNSEEYDKTAIIANMTNKKLLSLYMDRYGPMIGIGKLHTDASIEMKSYWNENSLYYDSYSSYSNSYVNVGSNTLNGAIYGSDNQALALSGVESYVYQPSSGGEATLAPLWYYVTTAIAFKDTSTRATPSDNYTNTQTLQGTLSQNIEGSTSTSEDLSITINKAQGTVSVATPTTSQLTISSTNSAYIHDNYFAALSTQDISGVNVMKDYLMAIPYGSTYGTSTFTLSDAYSQTYETFQAITVAQDDYVSWGYWGKSAIDGTNVTQPFSTWVAGSITPAQYISDLMASAASDTTYHYTGHVIGSVLTNGVTSGYILNDATNAIKLDINFKNSTIAGGMAFNASNGTSWSSTIAGTTTTPAITASTSSFAATLNGVNNTSGALKGNFYGPTTNSVGGSFNLNQGSTEKAIGSFKAIKSTVTTLPGV